MRERTGLVEKDHPQPSQRRQCLLLDVARSSPDYQRVAENAEDKRIKRILDEVCLIDPCPGSRKLVTLLERDHGLVVNRKRLRRLRREMGHEAIWCRPRTSLPDDGHRKFPYLLRNLKVTQADQVWGTDITYIPMPVGHAFLCAVMDWHPRKVLGWAVSNTMDTGLCLAALQQALDQTGRVPEIFNTGQGSQVYPGRVDGPASGIGDQNQHGWQGSMDG